MKLFNSAQLKWIAMSTMLIDHIGASLLERGYFYWMYNWQIIDSILRMIGRVAFPLYCFLLVEAFLHTRSKKKYVCSLAIMALFTEPIFDYAFFGGWYSTYQNVLFTLLIGFVLMICLQYLEKKISDRMFLSFGYFVFVFSFAYIAELLMTDYSSKGVFLIAVLYLLRAESQKELKCILGSFIFMDRITALIAFVLIYLYDGEKGELHIPHWIYRFFYPMHLAVLIGVQMML